jgi:hypothetical protein
MMPKCEALGYCPETKGCGRKKTRAEIDAEALALLNAQPLMAKEEYLELMQENAGVDWREVKSNG